MYCRLSQAVQTSVKSTGLQLLAGIHTVAIIPLGPVSGCPFWSLPRAVAVIHAVQTSVKFNRYFVQHSVLFGCCQVHIVVGGFIRIYTAACLIATTLAASVCTLAQ